MPRVQKTLFIILLNILFLGGCSWLPTQQVTQVFPSQQVKPVKPKTLEKLTASMPTRVLWQKSIGHQGKDYIKIHPFINKHAIYVAGAGSVVAMNKTSGNTLWTTALDETITGGVNGDENTIYVGTTEGNAVALDAMTGKTRWIAILDNEILAVSPSSNGRIVYRTSDGKLFGLSTQTGEIIWQRKQRTPSLSLRGASTPVISGSNIIVGFDNGFVVAYDLVSGKPQWDLQLGFSNLRTELDGVVDIDAEIANTNGNLFVGGYHGNIAQINAQSGQSAWSRKFSTHTGLASDSTYVYTTDDSGQIWKFNAHTGKPVWKNDDLLRRKATAPTLVGSSLIVVGDYQGYLHWINTTNGKIVARTNGDSKGFSVAPVVSGNVVYTFGRNGVLTAHSSSK
jgi:outer membrane protein assembly factor BamB